MVFNCCLPQAIATTEFILSTQTAQRLEPSKSHPGFTLSYGFQQWNPFFSKKSNYSVPCDSAVIIG